jgi:hypothetical protein
VGHKLKFVVSDLHIGQGSTADSMGQPDASSTSVNFVKFLHAIRDEGKQAGCEIELIINGDFLAFLQVPAVDRHLAQATHYPLDAYRDSSQVASVARLDIIVKTNPDIFYALSDFLHAEFPQRRLTIIKGNHDVSLFWPGVKGRLREVLGASGSRASLLRFADEFVCREQIYVEHGHQRAEKMNGYHDSFDPRALHNPMQLQYPAGSRFTIDFLNEAKREFWFVDRVKPVTTLIWYGFRWDFDFACRALASFIRHTPALVVSDFETSLFMPPATEDFLHTLENPLRRKALAQQYATNPDFRLTFHQQVQQYLDDATVDNKGEANLPFIEVSDDPLVMGRADQQRQHLMLHQAAQQVAAKEKARTIIFGHTHCAMQEVLPDGRIYINTGSWLEDLTNASPETWRGLFEGSIGAGYAPLWLPYARLTYDNQNNLTAELLYFKSKELSDFHN